MVFVLAGKIGGRPPRFEREAIAAGDAAEARVFVVHSAEKRRPRDRRAGKGYRHRELERSGRRRRRLRRLRPQHGLRGEARARSRRIGGERGRGAGRCLGRSLLNPDRAQEALCRPATECPGDALNALCPERGKRMRRLKEPESKLKSGGVRSILGELAPQRERGAAAANCINNFEGNRKRMRCDSYRERGARTGSGIAESSCRPPNRRAAPQAPWKPLDAQGGERHARNRMRHCEHALGGLHGLESRNVPCGLTSVFGLRPNKDYSIYCSDCSIVRIFF